MDKFICGVAAGAMIMSLIFTQVGNYAKQHQTIEVFQGGFTPYEAVENNITGVENESK